MHASALPVMRRLHDVVREGRAHLLEPMWNAAWNGDDIALGDGTHLASLDLRSAYFRGRQGMRVAHLAAHDQLRTALEDVDDIRIVDVDFRLAGTGAMTRIDPKIRIAQQCGVGRETGLHRCPRNDGYLRRAMDLILGEFGRRRARDFIVLRCTRRAAHADGTDHMSVKF